ncbi:hypothetical protein [Candidatus Bathycorpusculum sp.]|uniref:hypothetical protein n=1 Tax=Candidatus Bathycorpusculum sp. TaxID=2994959 RepID=UPI0028214F2D|nr:hypothetical protein [Candidatus Termitimicrobium sp.]MCL2432490.1 hypothetical protein [Candidatus Termitimicrobium sp.]
MEKEKINRKKAVNLVKQMSDVCGIDLDTSSLMLMPQNAEGIPSIGEQLHIKTELNFGSRLCLNALADENKLQIKETPEKIILVNPKENATSPYHNKNI